MLQSRRLFALGILLASVLLASGCARWPGGKQVVRVTPARAVAAYHESAVRIAQRAIKDCLSSAWHREFRARHGRAPVVRVLPVRLAGEAVVNSNLITSGIERAFVAGGVSLAGTRVISGDVAAELRDQARHASSATVKHARPSAARAADFVLIGAVQTELSASGGTRAQLVLSLVDVQRNVKVWMHSLAL